MYRNLTFLLLFSSTFMIAQQPDVKFGKISGAEWKMEYCDFDSTASAVILMEQCFIHFSNGQAYFRIHKRIKILDEKGIENGNLSVPYYHRDGYERILNFKGFTHFINEQGRVEKVSTTEEFREKINEYWSEFKVPFPAVKKGAIIEYRYEFETENLFSLDPWEFQHEIPTVYSAVSVELPNYLNYSILGFGQHFQAKYKGGDRKEWVLERLPGYKDEEFVFNPKDYIDQVRFQAFSQRTNNGWVEVVKDWDDLGTDLMRENYKKVFRKAKRNNELLTGLYDETIPDEEKVKNIFHFVQNKYRWNGFYSIYPGNSFNDLLEKKTGNIAALNLWLIALLKEAGFSADPVLISTKHHGKPIKTFPLLSQFNNVICAVDLGGKTLLLDVVERGGILPYDLLPPEDLNYIGLRLFEKSVEWINVHFSKNSKNQTLIELDFHSGSGNMKLRCNGYPASEKRMMLAMGKPLFDKIIFDNFSGEEIVVKRIKVSNEAKPEKSLVVDYEIDLGNFDNPKELYFNPAVWIDFSEAPFKKEERTLPVELPYPYVNQVAIKIIIPQGYQLVDAPPDLSLALPEKLGDFSYSLQNMQQFILVNIRFKMAGVYMAPESYFYLKEFHERISEKVNEVLVFQRI